MCLLDMGEGAPAVGCYGAGLGMPLHGRAHSGNYLGDVA